MESLAIDFAWLAGGTLQLYHARPWACGLGRVENKLADCNQLNHQKDVDVFFSDRCLRVKIG